MSLSSRDAFLRDYVFPVDAKHDFGNAGGPAQLAAGHPKEWKQADNVVDFGLHLNETEKSVYATYYTALSPDRKLLAITTVGRILVYDIASRELKEILEGTGKVCFRPVATAKRNTAFTDQTFDGEGGSPSGYTLVSSVPAEGRSKASDVNQLMLWELDQHGQILDIEEAIDADSLSMKAIQAIAPELQKHHEWTMEFINKSALHAKFAEALGQVAIDYRRRHNTIIKDAQLGSYGSVSFSNDGRLLLYHSKTATTPKGPHVPEKLLPQVTLYDLDSGSEIHHLVGHTDAIIWSAISPDTVHVASVSLDGSLRMHSVATGELEWATKALEEQGWTGSFSSDSRLVAWSSRSGRVVQVRDVFDGRKLSTFPIQLFDCCRCLQWHPLKPELALCAGRDAYVWDVLNGPGGRMLQHFRIDDGPSFGNRVASVESVGWLAGGSVLHLDISDGTRMVYNTESNAKEIFKRSGGAQTGYVEGGMYGIFRDEEGDEYYVSVDGDAKVRYWQRGIAASGSWWEKDPRRASTATKTTPETGKYVKITKPLHRVADR